MRPNSARGCSPEDLIRKLARQTSNENSKQLQRQVFIYNRIKADNDAIYSNVDAIHEAIQNNRQIVSNTASGLSGKYQLYKSWF